MAGDARWPDGRRRVAVTPPCREKRRAKREARLMKDSPSIREDF
jgi:hypothetical protein